MSNYPTALFRQDGMHAADIKFIKPFKNKTVNSLKIKLLQMTKKDPPVKIQRDNHVCSKHAQERPDSETAIK